MFRKKVLLSTVVATIPKYQAIRMLTFVWACVISSYESYAQYTCNHAPIGGGGFVTGIITHPTSGDIYCRTDIGGAYRWDAATSKWVQLLDWISDDEKNFSGVEALALDPQNANNVYMLCGLDYFNFGKTAILKSTDKGNTFTVIDVTSKFKAHGNGMGRSNGERLTVDPHNSNILFCGTRRDGLWKSTDAGLTWNLAWNGVTTTANDNGICFVLFDPSGSVVNGASQTMYIGVSRTVSANIYKSTNGGATFTAISATTSFMPHRAALAGTTMYVVHADADGPWNAGAGGIYKFNTSAGTWTNVTPGANNYSYGGVSIDPSNANRVVVSTINMWGNNQYGTAWGDFVYLSTNGGTNWTHKNGSNSTYNNDGIGWASGMLHWAGSIEFTPGNTAEVRAVSGNGVFTCSNIDAANPSWKFDVRGMEETGVTGGISIPGAPFISTFGDITGFVHNDLTSYPASTHQPADGSNWSIAYATANTNKLVRVGSSNIYYSTNQGATWTATSTNKGTMGKVAISADGGTILHCPNGSSTTWYTTNNGGSWTSASGVAISSAIPVADQVNSNYFYIHNLSNGQMLVSSNKGTSFSVAGNPGGTTTPWEQTYIRTVPGYEGHVWVPLIGNGLKYSTDHGATYTTVSNVTYCSAIGIGKADVSAAYPTVFIWGTVGGVRGLFRSTDKGETWIRVNDDAHQFGGTTIIFGDLNVFGRVYMTSVSGRGLIYWDQAGTLPITLLNFSGKENSPGYRMLNWEAFELNMSKYIIERSFDGKNFIDINAIPAKNSSAGNNTYSFIDSSYIDPAFKQLFYRLRMVGISEADQRSKTVLINLKNHESRIKIYPQPGSSAGITIEFVNSAGRSKDVVLMDILGNKIRSWYNFKDSRLFLSGLKAGVYLIKEADKKSENKTINKFVIQ